MPYKNEYACRLVSPDKFERFARMEREHDGKEYSVIIGWPGDGDEGSEDQSYRYHKDTWTEAAARKHCEEKEGTFEPLKKEEGTGAQESEEELTYYVNLFVGSPRNPFGTHNSFRFKGGAEGYEKAWRIHFSQVNGGALTPMASGPIRGTVRRVAMIAAGMKPPCSVVESEGLDARGGAKSPLPGTFPQRPSDYGLPSWLKPGEENVDREEALRFTCSDLNVIKRIAVGEIKRRIKDRKKKEEQKGIGNEEKEFFEWLEQEMGITNDVLFVEAKEYRLAYHIEATSLKEHRASVELLREGEWKHEDAPKGLLKVPLSLMQEFIQNFEAKVCGEKLPLDYGHSPDDKTAPGWITGMKITGNGNGNASIFATLDITDPEARTNIKNGSLCYISPQLFLGWEDPETGKMYNVIRSAALTNYPLIKNMRKIVANFEEVKKEVNEMLTEDEIKKKEEELKTKETELSEKEKGFADRETKLKEGEEILEKDKKEVEDVKLEQDKHPGPFYGLSKKASTDLADKVKAGDQKSYDIVVKYASGEIFRLSKAELQEDLKAVGIDVELGDLEEFDSTEKGKVKDLTDRVDKLEKEKDTATANFKATVDELSGVTKELREKKVEAKLEELIQSGTIVPAQRDALKPILMADKGSDTIELTEKGEGDKIVKSKVSMAEAVLKFLKQSPARVKLGQDGVVTPRTAVNLAEGLKKLVGMSQEEFDKLEPEVQESLLKKIEGFKG